MSKDYDIIIIGAGPGGYVAAIRAGQLGLKTAIIEKQHLGGICLNWGCIPTKALLRSAEIYRNIKHASEFGFTVGEPKIDIKKIVARSRQVAKKLTGGIEHLLKKNKITIINGEARLIGDSKIAVIDAKKKEQKLSAKHIIIATGARARVLEGFEPDGKLVWSYKEAMVPETLPKSMIVVGSGAIGVEFASFYNTLGVKVTLLEAMPRILSVEDEEIAKIAHKSFVNQGIDIKTAIKLKSLKKSTKDVEVTFTDKNKDIKLKAERLIMAVGVVGNVENLGLDNTAVQVERNSIKTDKWSKTAEAGVYAIGDVASAPWLAHKASHEAIICVENIAGQDNIHALNKANIPGCTYCHPQIASVGLTEAKAKEQGHDVRVGRFPFMGNGKAIALGEEEGMTKVIFDKKTGELLGAHMVGAEVTEMIQGFTIAKTLETTEAELMHTIFPHPTISETMHESVLDAFGRVIHM